MPALAVPAIAVAIAALVALLVLYGIAQLTKLVGNMMPDWHIPLLGSLKAWVLAAADVTLAATEHYMSAAVHPIVAVIEYPITVVERLFEKVNTLGAAVYATLHWVAARAIPAAIHGLRTLTWAHVASVAATLRAAIARVSSNVWQGIHAAEHAAAANLTRVSSHVWQGIHAVERSVAADVRRLDQAVAAAEHQAIAAAESYTRTAVAKVSGTVANVDKAVGHALATAESYADKAVATATAAAEAYASRAAVAAAHQVDTAAAAAIAGAWGSITDQATALESLLGTDLPNIGAAVRAIPRAVPTDVATAVAGAAAAVVPALRYMEECGIPNCRNLSAFGRAVSGLLDDLEAGAFIAMLAELASNPSGGADVVRSVLGPVATGVVDTAHELLGV